MRGRWRVAAVLLCLPAAAAAQPSASPPDNALRGRLVFEAGGCERCHRLGGDGRDGVGPDLAAGSFEGSFLDLGAELWNHVPGMSAELEAAGADWPTLSEDETLELVAFLYFIEYLGRPGVARRGAELFASQGCGDCHAVAEAAAAEPSPPAPNLSRLESYASPLFVAQAIWNHGPGMLAAMQGRDRDPPTFSEGDLADLSAFVRQAAGAGPKERRLLAPGNPNRGRELFVAKGCGTCHGADARGSAAAPDLEAADLHRSAEGIAAIMWNHVSQMGEMMRRQGLGWPTFTTPELADLVAFLYFLPFEDPEGDAGRGARVFAERSCADCHAAPEGSGARGPELEGGTTPVSLVTAMWNHAPIMKEAVLEQGLPWPALEGRDLRDLVAFLSARAGP